MRISHILIASSALAVTLAAQQKGAPADFAQDLQQNYNAGKTKIMAMVQRSPQRRVLWQHGRVHAAPEAGASVQPGPRRRRQGRRQRQGKIGSRMKFHSMLCAVASLACYVEAQPKGAPTTVVGDL